MDNTAELRNIYSSIQDDESKDIFANRLMYSLLGDENYIDIIIKKYTSFHGLNREGVVYYLLLGLESRDKTYPLVVYGCGEMATIIAKEIGSEIFCFCDRDEEKQKMGFLGKTVISLDELIKKKNEVRVIIGSIDYYEEIFDLLQQNEIKVAFDNRKVIGEWLRLVEKQYFEPDIIQYKDKEVFIDGGCLNYGTVKQLLKKCSSKIKVYAFEPDPASYQKCREEAKHLPYHDYTIIPKGLYLDSRELYFDSKGNGCSGISEEGTDIINVCSIDDEINDTVTFIKMDIEGAELDALKGAQKTIQKYHPKLAICIYHKPEDVIEIPKYILSLNSDYKLYLRHYSDNTGETVLYAI